MSRKKRITIILTSGLLVFVLVFALSVLLSDGIVRAVNLAATQVVYLPLVMHQLPPTPTQYACPASSSNQYGQGIAYQFDGDNPVRPAYAHADKNLALRGYTLNTDPGLLRELVNYGSDDPTQPPQFATLFTSNRVPALTSFSQVHNWSWAPSPAPGTRADPITSPKVAALGLRTIPGETLRVPASGYNIGGGMEVLVLFADNDTVALRYTREDSSASPGYTVHIDNICTDPNLLALYNQLDNPSGPRYVYPNSSYNLVNMPAGHPIGTARDTEIVVAISDSGAFQDPRSCNEWWQVRPGYSGACPPHD